MIDITHKASSLRRASASGEVHCSASTIAMIRENRLPKGDLFNVARAAALLGAKNTDRLIPHCHPVSIDSMQIEFETLEDRVVIHGEGASIGRTGIEMEVLTAVTVAALVIYDLLKPVDKELSIEGVKLNSKSGGKSDRHRDSGKGYTAAILTCSDSTDQGSREDRSGDLLQERMEKEGLIIAHRLVVPDNVELIRETVRKWAGEGVHFIFTTGGTGLSPGDVTVEAVEPVLDRTAPGVVESMRIHGVARTPRAMLSRAVAGSIGESVIVTLPGSSNGVRESLDGILPTLFHARKMILRGGHE